MITRALFDRIFSTKGLISPRNLKKYNLVRERDALIAALNKFLPIYLINNYLRICAFFSCCGIETDYFRTTSEYASGRDYNRRSDLGNFFDGDGEKFKGSSLIQTTGRYNFWRVTIRFVKKLSGIDHSKGLKKYRDFKTYLASSEYKVLLADADRLGVNFLEHPELLRDNIEIAVEAACIFWEENNLNKFADAKEIKALNGLVNKGSQFATPLAWDKRNELYATCAQIVPKNISLIAATKPADVATNQPLTAMIPPVIENSPENLAVPSIPPPSDLPAKDESGSKSKVKEIAEKYIKHCPEDTLKNILTVIAARISASVSTIWALGLRGQILLIAAGLLLVGFIAYALYYYAPRIFGWARDIADSLIGNE